MEKIPGKSVGSFIYVYNDYTYNKDNRTENIFRCNTRRTTGCRGAIKDIGDGCIRLLHDHNHSRLLHRIDQHKINQEMLQLCRETAFPLKEIFDHVCRKYPNAASVLSYSRVKAILLRERQKNYPSIPPCLAALYEYLRASSFMENIFKVIIRDEDGKTAILFSTEMLLQTLNTSQCIYADGTFSVLPTQPSIAQLYIVHILYMDTGVGTVFILCEALTKAMYTALWSKINELSPMLNKNLRMTMTDYEMAAMSALEQQFPLSDVKGCWFHYNQALLRKWRYLGLGDAPTKVLSMAMTLALAPADLFENGFSEIHNESVLIITEYPTIGIFIKYLQTTWLPKMNKVSVHDCPIRTNNTSESYNNIVSSKLGKGKKDIWKFLEHLEQLIMDEEIKVKRLSAGQSVRRESNKKTILRNNKIETLQKRLANGRLTLKEFLLSFYKGNKIVNYGNDEDFRYSYLDCSTNSTNATVVEDVEEGQTSRSEVADKTQCSLGIYPKCATNSINLRTVKKTQVQVRKKHTNKVLQDKVKELVTNGNIILRQPRIILDKI